MSTPPTRKKVVRKLLPVPDGVSSLTDLLQLAQSGKRYAHLDMDTLWRIVPQLLEIEALVGMASVKQTLFYQIVFYLQQLVAPDTSDYLHTMILGPPGSGKCLGRDTPVLMYNGSVVLVQDIQAGDLVMSPDSQPRTVSTTCRGIDALFRIQNRYVVNASHIISLVDATRTQFWDVSLDEFQALSAEEQREWFMYKTHVVFPKVPTPIDPYAFGYVYMAQYVMYGALHLDIPDARIQQVLSPFVRHKHWNVFEWVVEPSLVQCSVLPDCYTTNAPQVLEQVLLGMYDAVGTRTAQNTYTMVLSDRYVQGVLHLHNLLGLRYTAVERESFVDDQRVASHWNIELHDVLRRRAYPPALLLEPVTIEPIGTGAYYGFELQGEDGHFLLGDCLVTHNTTVAHIISDLYTQMGLLSAEKNAFTVATREDFVGEFLGHTAVKTKKLLNSCVGGVLLIDEVYALGPGAHEKDSFSKEAIDTLNLFLSEHSHDFCCIVAGYADEVRDCFLSVNKGLERRFQWVHYIEPYTPEQLVDIFTSKVNKAGWSLSISREQLVHWVQANPTLFRDNGGSIENLLTKCKMVHARRVLGAPPAEKRVLSPEDLEGAVAMMATHRIQEEVDTVPFGMYC